MFPPSINARAVLAQPCPPIRSSSLPNCSSLNTKMTTASLRLQPTLRFNSQITLIPPGASTTTFIICLGTLTSTHRCSSSRNSCVHANAHTTVVRHHLCMLCILCHRPITCSRCTLCIIGSSTHRSWTCPSCSTSPR